jgi:hypothetical protein
MVRNWIKCKVQNGEHVTWGSDDVLGGFDRSRIDSHKQFTVKEIEDIAKLSAEGAYSECLKDIYRLICDEICTLNIKAGCGLPIDADRFTALKNAKEVLFGR